MTTPSAPSGDHGGLRGAVEGICAGWRKGLQVDGTHPNDATMRMLREFEAALAAHPVPEPAQVGEVGAVEVAALLLEHARHMIERVNEDDPDLLDYAAACACGEWNAFDNDGLHVDHVAAVLVTAGVTRA